MTTYLYPFPTRSMHIFAADVAAVVAAGLVHASNWFAVTPLPDGVYEFATKLGDPPAEKYLPGHYAVGDIVGGLDSAERHDLNEQLRKFTPPPARDDGGPLDTVEKIQAALLAYRPDLLDIIHSMASDRDYDALTLGQYRGLIKEEAYAAGNCTSTALPMSASVDEEQKYGNDLHRIVNRIVIGPITPGHPDAVITADPVSAKELSITLLATVPMEVPEAELAKLTPEQRWEAANWAAAVHLDASDNLGVVVPPKPEFLSQYKECEF